MPNRFMSKKKGDIILKRKLSVLLVVLIVSLTTCVEAVSFVPVLRDHYGKATWYLDKSSVSYEDNLLYFMAMADYDSANLNGYKRLVIVYKAQPGELPMLKGMEITYYDSMGNVVGEDLEEDEEWIEMPRGTVGYALVKVAEKYVK